MKKILLFLSICAMAELAFSQNDFFSGTWSNEDTPKTNFSLSEKNTEWVFKGDSVFIKEIDTRVAGNGYWSKGTFSIIGDTLNFYIVERAQLSFNTGFAQHWKCSPNLKRYVFKKKCDSILCFYDLDNFMGMKKHPGFFSEYPIYSIIEKTNNYPIKSWDFSDFCQFHRTDY